jgi:glycosyltransferase involved in cell wall biosynthesis
MSCRIDEPMPSQRVTIAIGGLLTTCPRMVKAADALASVGYSVRVVSLLNDSWASPFEAEVAADRVWRWSPVDLRRSRRWMIWFKTSLRRKLARRLVRSIGPAPLRLPSRLLGAAVWRGVTELVDEVCAEPTDLVYAGTSAGLAVAPFAARQLSAPFAVDLEDFHSAEQTDSRDAALDHDAVAALESRFLRGAVLLTAGSEGIAQAYRARYGISPIPIHNVFSLPQQDPPLRPVSAPPRRLYWFSQTVGLDRGLQDVIQALGLAGTPSQLYLQGNPAPGAEACLRRLASTRAPRVDVTFLAPVSPDMIVPGLAHYDIGLAVEPPVSANRRICLSNKALAYTVGGMPVVMTEMDGQRRLAASLGQGALIYQPGDFVALASALDRWLTDDESLRHASAAVWQAAKVRWHWEHPSERGALLEGFRRLPLTA